MALVTLSEVKTFLGILGTSQDAVIAVLIPVGEELVQKKTKRRFGAPTQVVEYYSGSGLKELSLRQSPVHSVGAVWEDLLGNFGQSPDSPFSTAELLTQGIDYAVSTERTPMPAPGVPSEITNIQPTPLGVGILVRLNNVWARMELNSRAGFLPGVPGDTPGNIKVVYTCYSTPEAIKYAISLCVQYMLGTASTGGLPLESEKIGQYQYKLAGDNYSKVFDRVPTLNSILASYTEIPIA